VKNQILKLTATEAARDFARLLDRVEHGAEAVIERHSEPVAMLTPVYSAPRRVSECLAVKLPKPSARADREFAADLEEIIRGNPAESRPAWD